MENEEEENSKLPLQLENDSTMTAVTATTNAQSPNGLPCTEPQCGPHPEAEECQPQLGAGDGESQFLSTETETKLPDTREYRDAVAGENTSAVDVGDMEVGGVRVQSQSPPSLSPQLPLAEGGQDESAKVEQQSVQVEEEDRFIKTSEIMQEVPRKDEKDRDLIPSEGGHEAKNNSYSPNNNDDDGDAYKGVEDNDGDVNAGLEVPGVNNGTEIKAEVIADVVNNSEMAAEQKVTCRTEEPALADEVEKNIGKTDVKEQSNEEATDVAEGAKIADMGEDLVEVKEENEVETDVEGEKEEIREEYVLAEEMEVAEQTEMGDIAEETKAAEEVPNGTGEMNEMELADRMEVQDKEEMYVANAGEEMEETEETEETKAAEEVPNETGEMDEMELADSMEEQDKEEMHVANVGEETEEMEETEETEEADNAVEMELADGTDEAGEEVEEVSKSAGGKRKRGKNVKASARTLSRKKMEEDVCFICFDGGDLVLCDRRGCPKAYHPTCVNRDEAFFRAKGRWNCGWHLCSICEKNAYYMCYTCTFSLCKGCIKDAVILCVRGNKGFCESCLKTVMLIERNEQENKETAQVDFDDKSSWEYLFKDYWLELKGRLSLTSDELSQAKNPWKGSELSVGKRESRDELYDAHNCGGSGSGNSSGSSEVNPSKKGKAKKRLKYHSKERDSTITKNLNDVEEALKDESTEWASKELLEFIMHMKNGDKSGCSQFDVQALLLEYIKINKLRDPRRKSQIICDSRLEKLFRKPRVGHFEMLKLLESHFLLKEDSQADDLQGSVVDTEANSEADGNSDGLVKGSKDRRRRSCKKSDGRGLQSNFDDYAAIDTNNINLIYIRRSLVENLIDDAETFHDKVVGSFVRIRISGSAQKQDLYRLVQVVGTNKAAEPYKVGKRTTDFLLDILNLNKTEIVSIDIISNQDFTEDECKRLRQSIKCGLINRLTVGDIQEKAMALQAVRVEDSLEAEITRLSHLRDRASDLGRRKELRECVEKLQLLKSPKERQRRLEEIPEVHADPNMDPSYESEEDGEMDDKRQENYLRPGGSSFNRRGREPISPGRGREPISPGRGSLSSNDSWSGSRSYSSTKRELSRSSSNKGFSIKRDDVPGAGEILSENLWSQGRDKETQPSQSWEKPKSAPTLDARTVHSSLSSESIPIVKQEIAMGPPATAVAQSATKINETEKIWHYKDPSGKIQGPFSIVQLRKWSNTGYFPAELRIWRTTEKQDDSILLTDALTGNFQRDPELVQSQHLSSSYSINAGEGWKSQREISNSTGRAAPTPLEVSKYSTDKWDSETNLPSPTPAQAARSATKGQPYESKWSPTQAQSAGSHLGTNSLAGGNGEMQHPAVIVPESGQLSHSSTPSSSLIKLPGSANSPRMHSQSTLPGESPRVQVTSHLLPAPDSSAASVNVAVDMKSLQNLVNPVAGNNPLVVTQGWGTVSVSKAEMGASHAIPASGSQVWGSVPSQNIEQNNSVPTSAHPGAYGNWGDTQPSVHNSALSFTAGNPSGVSSAPATSGLVPSDIWRGAIQSNIQPSAPSNAPWGMSIADNQAATPRQGPENQNSAWGPIPGNPNLGWGGSVPTNSNQGWVVSGQGPAPGNANLGWIQHGQGQAPGNGNPGWAAPVQGQALGNAFPGWVPSGQGPAPVNANQAWVATGQGPSHGNGHSGWTAPPGNVGSRGSEKSQSGGRFSSQRESGSQGGDSDYGGTKPWNRQSSFSRGGDSSRPAFKGQRVCKYHENGHCKKGAACDYLHT